MYRIKREYTEAGLCFTLVDPNDGYVAKRVLPPSSKAFIAPLALRELQGILNTRLVLDCGGAR